MHDALEAARRALTGRKVVVTGGGDVLGSLATAGIMGEMFSVFSYFTNDTFGRFVLFVLVVIFLRFRPQGIFAPSLARR